MCVPVLSRVAVGAARSGQQTSSLLRQHLITAGQETSSSSSASRISGRIKQHPLLFASGLLSVKGIICDVFVQKAVEKKETWNYERTAILSCYGGLFEAPLAYSFYSILFPRLWPVRSVANVTKMLLVDNLLLWPWLVYPTYYSLNTFIDNSTFSEAFQKYLDEFWEVNRVSIMVWVPTNIFNFFFVPTQMRCAFMASVALLYTSFWSYQQAQLREKPQGVLSVSTCGKGQGGEDGAANSQKIK